MKTSRKLLLFIALTVIAVSGLCAQDNSIVDRFLEQDQADLDTTIYLVMVAGGKSPDGTSVEAARSEYEALFRLPKMKDGTITVGDFAFVGSQTLGIPRGVMSRVFFNERYAAKDMQGYGIIPGDLDARDYLTGEGVLSLLGYAVTWKENHQ